MRPQTRKELALPGIEYDADNEKLLVLNHQIRETEHALTVAQARARRSNIILVLGPILGLILYAMWWLAPVSGATLRAIYIPAIPMALAFCIASYYLKRYPATPQGTLTDDLSNPKAC
jgi:hypothetical protein